ncbi:xanthine dehydrogenase accessory factor [Sediminihabitans luteus]|uniref:Xanthine dehydrogenase accessory factor n=1 Tax=Sediminihabitans luteus TaxID=1138585 RepID=A0A2M9CYN3_9CELL|nr:XdhC/CoxI family protein [Sediminihabitans luteus]PJJ77046.1 xanthine dehydrogenase accessory factor [Sediminihabitans luteus]GII99688.1 hypothetical protein Slu03_20660 [Sediminihabitans luteus]
MLDVAADLLDQLRCGRSVVVATTVGVTGSAPRPVGTSMVLTSDDGHGSRVVGSLTGGCVEAAVLDVAHDVARTGRPRLERFGFGDDAAFAVGLACGGAVEVLVQRLDPATLPATVRSALEDAVAERDVRLALDLPSGRTVLLERAAPPRCLVVGAIDHAAAVAELAAFLGYRVTVCDARATFATRERFPAAHEVVVAWPDAYLASTPTDERTVLLVLTHDEKFDVPVLAEALGRDLAFVGAMGSRATHARREAALRALGVDDAALARVRGPVGLDLGALTPAETAVSILAEVVAARTGRTGRPLTDVAGPIHGTAVQELATPGPRPTDPAAHASS